MGKKNMIQSLLIKTVHLKSQFSSINHGMILISLFLLFALQDVAAISGANNNSISANKTTFEVKLTTSGIDLGNTSINNSENGRTGMPSLSTSDVSHTNISRIKTTVEISTLVTSVDITTQSIVTTTTHKGAEEGAPCSDESNVTCKDGFQCIGNGTTGSCRKRSDHCTESQSLACAVDPCDSAKCHSDIAEGIVCLADFCKDCNYVSFYVSTGQSV